ncbi:hypothetical protein [Erwinia endophytica]|nr:hypothetical protein [Erwinia endophytica]
MKMGYLSSGYRGRRPDPYDTVERQLRAVALWPEAKENDGIQSTAVTTGN